MSMPKQADWEFPPAEASAQALRSRLVFLLSFSPQHHPGVIQHCASCSRSELPGEFSDVLCYLRKALLSGSKVEVLPASKLMLKVSEPWVQAWCG